MTYDPFSWLHTKYTAAKAADAQLDGKLSTWLDRHAQLTQTNRAASTYASDADRLAYCLGHFAMGVRTVARELALSNKAPFPFSATFFGGSLDIVSLGSGPGSDLVGAILSLGAIPRRLTLHAADAEAGWETWVSDAVASIRASDPALAAVADPKFAVLDLNDVDATRAYLAGIKPNGATLYVLHRVLGTLRDPIAVTNVLLEQAGDEAMILVVAPPKDSALLESFAWRLEHSKRRGWCKLVNCGVVPHLGFTVPKDIWDALTHKPETKAEYECLHYVMDVATTLRLPGPAPAG